MTRQLGTSDPRQIRGGGDAATPRVIFIDDEPEVLEGLRLQLRGLRRQWEMSFHESAAEALPVIESSPGAVVVSDWMMPGVSGLSLCRRVRLRSTPEGPSCYIILLTGQGGTEELVTALGSGADDFIAKPYDVRELIARVRVGLRVNALEERLRETTRELARQASTDPLTQLANRRRAEEVLSAELEQVGRGGRSSSVILADIDHFKRVNDEHGHEAGDRVLREVARRLREICRAYDVVTRWGGEEFLVVCPGTGRAEVARVAERLRRTTGDETFPIDAQTRIPVTLSLGTATAAIDRRVSVGEIVAEADAALYAAKDAGRDCVRP